MTNYVHNFINQFIKEHDIDINKKLQSLFEVSSLDVSIKHLKKEISTDKKAFDFVLKKLTVEEKIDGTKLILIRTDKDDEQNWYNNWILSYKGNILYPDEFKHLSDTDKQGIKTSSIGISQYALVFDKIKDINYKSIPKNTGFSIEFAQNKETLTRTYKIAQGLFLRSYSTVKYYINKGFLTLSTSGEVTNKANVVSMAKKLGMYTFPILMDGYINTPENFKNAIKNDSLLAIFEQHVINYSDSLNVVANFADMVLKLESSLGGTSEGVVITTQDGKLYKVTQEDQYDTSVRGAKKDLYKMEPEKEQLYNQTVRETAKLLIQKLDVNKPLNIVLGNYNELVKKVDLSKIEHTKKSDINKLDDLMLTGKFIIQQRLFVGFNTKTLGVVPMAGKPVHDGHWKLIELASKENQRVIVYVSDKGRTKKGEYPITGEQMIEVWNDVLSKYLPSNASIKFVDSPVANVRYLLSDLNADTEDAPVTNIYSDVDDIQKYDVEELKSKYSDLYAAGKIQLRGIERTSTTNISGTKMREFLQNKDKPSFFNYLPQSLSTSDKQTVWNILTNNMSENISINLATKFINELDQNDFNEILTLWTGTTNKINESGKSIAGVDPKVPKTYQGQLAQATQKVDISGGNRDIISSHIRTLALQLNDSLKFWRKDNPYIQNGYIFNGSSQHLMNPDVDNILKKITNDPDISLEKIKSKYGDIDIIIPKEKLESLKSFLDGKDDNATEWNPSEKNKVTNEFYYVGRTKSGSAIPDQLVTLFWYKPNNQIVQVDFEGDDMVIDDNGFEKPSIWTKFSKDSPLDDLSKGIKGLAGAILLRSLARGTTRINDVIVLTPGGAKKYKEGKPLTPRDISSNQRDQLPSEYTLNTGGGGVGVRKAYKLLGKVDGKDAYEFIEAKVGRSLGPEFASIIDLNSIFKIIFKKNPSAEDISNFRSFQGLLRMMSQNLDKTTIKVVMERFNEILTDENVSQDEVTAIKNAITSNLK